MIISYLKIAFRNLFRQKGYSFINIFGLSAGISACIFISGYVISELKYDKHHKDAGRIYRINTQFDFPDQKDKIARNSMAFGPQFLSDYPEVEEYLRIFLGQKQTVRNGEKMFSETNIAFADSNLLSFFDYNIIEGDPKTILNAPGSVIISDKKADIYFGSAAGALDQFLEFQNKKYRVTGVFRTPEKETHLYYDFYISLSTLPKPLVEQAMWDYMWMLTYTYIKVKPNTTLKQLNEKLISFHKNRVEPWLKENNVQGKLIYHAQPLTDIHLDTEFAFDVPTKSNPLFISIFIIAGIFILIIASFNYVNLVTARSVKRAREVGLRKVLGAGRKQIVYQFMGESTLITFIAYIGGFLISAMLLNSFNELTGKNFTESTLFSSDILLPLLLVFIFITILAGSYPALFLSRFNPSQVLKIGIIPVSSGGRFKNLLNLFTPANLRKLLIVFQFAISIILIIGTIIIYNQFNYLKNKDLGFNKDQILVIDIPNDSLVSGNLQTIKNEFLTNPDIKRVSTVSNIPGMPTGVLYFNVEHEGQMVDRFLNFIFIDDEYLPMMGIPVVMGRNFSQQYGTDTSAFVINQAAADFLSWKEPLEKKMVNGLGKDGKVIGVVKDFNYATLHSGISPLVMMYAPVTQGFLLLKISADDIQGTLNFIDKKWGELVPSHPADRFFLDDNFDKLYQKERNMLSIFGYFASLAIIISCMGLFSLASLIAEQKTKEIGIRKILGASVPGIAGLLSVDFLKLVLISNIIAIPAAYYGMTKWLENFAYRIDISFWFFVIAATGALIIASVTVSYQAVKAATANPVKSLRYE